MFAASTRWMAITLQGPAPAYREHEFFIRFKSNLRNFHKKAKKSSSSSSSRNSSASASTEFFTDQNGFQMTRRVYVNSVGVEANYYPVTTSAFIQDRLQRLNILVASSSGLTSPRAGWIEFMIDRRTIYDDGRGMGEGMSDNLPTVTPFILILEDRFSSPESHSNQPPASSLLCSVVSTQLLYPATSFVLDTPEAVSDDLPCKSRVLLLNQPLPCNVHLLNLRTLSEPNLLEAELPSTSALLTLHNRAYDCSVPVNMARCDVQQQHGDRPLYAGTEWNALATGSVEKMSLTGLRAQGLTSYDDMRIPLMQMRSYNVTFA